ncbi:hypothetical protein MMSR116_18720 [Methylobacterium mesophilicum SR1.6/6]|uniref:Uncharacterized protein n=1 Tax=Methylobacterium mesophilicum SR1.6/6 TaxID=908290 RepID=A0A6B9FM59_9HYPH|nr:hypothetical protein [Methylobacterium mesophilicum]QGY03701.1 hypothetical protein MMSR116_18720 [Methylobacterium mesophilicum SR1.6/6]
MMRPRRFRTWSLALLVAALSGAAQAQPRPGDALPPDAAATPGTNNSTVGSTGQTPNVAYPQAPAATPAAEGADRARPPTEREKEEQKLR